MQIVRINRPFVLAVLAKVPLNDVIRIVIIRARVHFRNGSPVSSQSRKTETFIRDRVFISLRYENREKTTIEIA